MHEYLAPLKERHAECKWCGKRSPHICMRCGYCYSCHSISEEVEKRRVLPTSA